jgi:hypothetical protein
MENHQSESAIDYAVLVGENERPLVSCIVVIQPVMDPGKNVFIVQKNNLKINRELNEQKRTRHDMTGGSFIMLPNITRSCSHPGRGRRLASSLRSGSPCPLRVLRAEGQGQ